MRPCILVNKRQSNAGDSCRGGSAPRLAAVDHREFLTIALSALLDGSAFEPIED
jgi:hypothetical protein